jgi:UDP-N-acetyl-D-mannosaminuronic acid dehydrogenase
VTLAERLRDRTTGVAVWGAGFIGLSTAASFAAEGVRALCVDVAPGVVEAIRHGRCPVRGLEHWLGFDVGPLVAAGLLGAAASNDHDPRERLVHFIAVPTERNDLPWLGALWDVVGRVARAWETEAGATTSRRSAERPMVILESTLVPGTAARVAQALPAAHVVVAPRRDWFVGPDRTLKRLARVYGADVEEAADEAAGVLGIVCDNLHRAKSSREAEVVKAVENAYRHLSITLANQLASAYPDLDMHHVMKLAATKWNFGEAWRPSIGISGYCLPVAGPYLLAGAAHPEALTLLTEAQRSDRDLPFSIADALKGYASVAVLGLSYKDGLHVHQMAVGVRLARALLERGVEVRVHDPLCDRERCMSELVPGARWLALEAGKPVGQAVVVATGHGAYRAMPPSEVRALLSETEVLLDNEGIWSGVGFRALRYVRPGAPGWLSALSAVKPESR